MIAALKNNKDSNISIVMVLLILIVYFLAVTGPIVGVKYRLPLEPILTLFTTYFLITVRLKFFKKIKFVSLFKKE
jgi:hypothetical protein